MRRNYGVSKTRERRVARGFFNVTCIIYNQAVLRLWSSWSPAKNDYAHPLQLPVFKVKVEIFVDSKFQPTRLQSE